MPSAMADYEQAGMRRYRGPSVGTVMARLGFIGAVLSLWGALVLGGAQAAPLDAYGELPSTSFMTLSPSGQRIAFATPMGQTLGIAVKDMRNTDKPITLALGNSQLSSLKWAGDDYLVVTTRVTTNANNDVISAKGKFPIAFVFDIARRRTTELAPPSPSAAPARNFVPVGLNVVNAAPVVRLVKGRVMVFFDAVAFDNTEGVHALYSYDLQNNSFQQVIGPSPGQTGFVVDSDGQVAAISTHIGDRWTLKLNPTSLDSKSFSVEAATDVPSLLGLGRTPGTVWVSFPDALGEREWREISIKSGTSANDLTDFQKKASPIFDPNTDMVVGGYRIQQPEAFYDPDLETFWSAIVKAFGNEDIDLISMSRDHSKFLVRAFGANNGFSYLLVDRMTGRADPITDAYRALAPADIASVRPLSYAEADGLQIPAYLTVPKGRPAQALPLIVLPHESADGWNTGGFDWLAQAFASRGYAVLMPQFRGSSEQGAAFRAAGFGQWGGKMQTDLSDGVRALAAQGVIDPNRVCIVGSAYGGFAALTGVTQEPGVYRCAVSIDAITDLKAYLDSVRNRSLQHYTSNVRYWERMLGAKPHGDPANLGISPVLNAGKASAPILLIETSEDTVVPPVQTEAMADALQKSGKPHEFVVLKGEDHGLTHDQSRKQALQAIIRFIEANNPPDPPIKTDSVARAR